MNVKNRLLPLLVVTGLLVLNQNALAQQASAVTSTGDFIKTTGALPFPGEFVFKGGMRLLDALELAGGTLEQTSGDVQVRSHSPCTIGFTITDRLYKLADLLRGDENANPYLQPGDQITVFSTVSPKVCIVGNVFRPQVFYLQETLTGQLQTITVSQAIAIAGGSLSGSRLEKIIVIRQLADQTRQAFYVNLNLIQKGRSEDITLRPYDIVSVLGKKRTGDRFDWAVLSCHSANP